MTGSAVALLVTGVVVGAFVPAPIPAMPAGALALVALGGRRPLLFCLAASLLASGCSYRAWAGLVAPPPGPVAAEAVLVTDPEPMPGGGIRSDVRMAGRRVEVVAGGAAAAALRSRLAGERVALVGRVRPLPPYARNRFAARHVAARLTVSSVRFVSAGSPPVRVANSVRRLLDAGSRHLPVSDRSLLSGIVLGDDREQPQAIAGHFRAAGLSHLLAVSGQNVAFVLLVSQPLLARLGLRSRFALSLAVLGLFGMLTRWEPSVLRAVAMAAAASFATASGRPASSGRVLGLAVAGLVIVDPLLVHSLGFRLSVAACAGIVALSGRIERALRGPPWITLPAAVTASAQLGVAPVLLPVFGAMPLVALPANLLAGPAAGPLMAWGLVAGPAAGLFGQPFATVLHVPTRVLVGWIAGVARVASEVSTAELRGAHLVVLVSGVLAVGVVRRFLRRR